MRTTVGAFIFAVLVLGLALSAVALADPPARPASVRVAAVSSTARVVVKPISGLLAGVVIRKGTTQRLNGATVNIYRRETSGGWSWVGQSSTSASGYYEAGLKRSGGHFESASGYYGAALQTGTYRVGFSYSGNGWRAAPSFFDGVSTLSRAKNIAVTRGILTTHINGRLEPMGHITGVVRGPSGTPLPSMGVSVFAKDPGTGRWEPRGWGFASASGYYDAAVDSSGAFKVRYYDPRSLAEFMDAWQARYAAQYYGGANTVTAGRDVVVKPGVVTSGIDASLKTGGHITGVVSNASGRPQIAQVFVWERNANGGLFAKGGPLAIGMTKTSESGYYDVGGLGTGDYSVSADACWPGHDRRFLPGFFAGAAHVAAPSKTTGIDIVAPIRRTALSLGVSVSHKRRFGAFALSGRVSPGGKGDRVRVEYRMTKRGPWVKAGIVKTGKGGVWRLGFKPSRAGTYYFRATFWGGTDRSAVTTGVRGVTAKR